MLVRRKLRHMPGVVGQTATKAVAATAAAASPPSSRAAALSVPALTLLLMLLLLLCSAPASCEVPKFVFIKTHKTGSSSITVMLAHALEKRGLKPAIPCIDHLGFPAQFVKPERSLCGPDPLNFHAAISHIRWTETSKRNLLDLMRPAKPLVFTTVRDPLTRFVSGVRYFGDKSTHRLLSFNNKVTEEWLVTALQFLSTRDGRQRLQPWLRPNVLYSYAYDFGLANDYPAPSDDFRKRAQRFVDSLDFVLLYEEWNLSLAVLKRNLNMTYADLVSPHLKNAGTSSLQISEETQKLLCQVLWADCLLYDMLVVKFRKSLSDDLRRDADVLGRLNERAAQHQEGQNLEDVQDFMDRYRRKGRNK